MRETVTILLVEDDEIAIACVRRGFSRQKLDHPLRVAHDGEEALRMLRDNDPEKAIRRPYLILLDINMPRMNGLEFLDEIRKDPELAGSVVFMLTTSQAEGDLAAAYSRNVAGYVVKSNVGAGFAGLAHFIDTFCRHVEFPPSTRRRVA